MLPWPVWLSCLGIIAKCRVAGLIPSQGTCMCCCLWSGAYRRQLINVSLPLFSLPSSLSENKINKIFYKRVECHSGQKRKQFKKTGASSTKQCYKGGAGGQLTKASLLPRLHSGSVLGRPLGVNLWKGGEGNRTRAEREVAAIVIQSQEKPSSPCKKF